MQPDEDATEFRDALLRDVPRVDGRPVLEPVVLSRRLGEGAMGAVFAGRHENLGIEVAVKCLLDSRLGPTEATIRRFQHEAQTAAQVHSPHLVRVYDVRQAFGLHYIVMELVDGETVEERVDRVGPLDVRTACEIVRDAASGVAAAHAAGVIHRDVKPANLLISRSGTVKVADLGVAKSTRSATGIATAPDSVMGTPAYMPVELFDGAVNAVPASDVYALGLTLAFMLLGRDVVDAPTMSEVIAMHHRGIPTLDELAATSAAKTLPPRGQRARMDTPFPRSVVQLIRGATARDARDRHQDAAALVVAVDAALATMGDGAGDTGRPVPSRAWTWIAGLVVLALIVAGLRVVIFWNEPPPVDPPTPMTEGDLDVFNVVFVPRDGDADSTEDD